MKKIKEIKRNTNYCTDVIICICVIIVAANLVCHIEIPKRTEFQAASDYINFCNAEHKVLSITKHGDRLWYKVKTSTGSELDSLYITDDFTKDCTMFEINRLRDRVSRLENSK